MNETHRKLCEMIDRELEKLTHTNGLENAGVREALDELTHAKKSLLAIDAMEQSGSFFGRGYSYGYDGMNGGSGIYRDDMGRFASRDGYNSYGSGRDGMMRHLEDMRRSATNEAEQRNIDRWMRELNNG